MILEIFSNLNDSVHWEPEGYRWCSASKAILLSAKISVLQIGRFLWPKLSLSSPMFHFSLLFIWSFKPSLLFQVAQEAVWISPLMQRKIFWGSWGNKLCLTMSYLRHFWHPKSLLTHSPATITMTISPFFSILTGLLCGYFVSYGDGCSGPKGVTNPNVVPKSYLPARLSPKRSRPVES